MILKKTLWIAFPLAVGCGLVSCSTDGGNAPIDNTNAYAPSEAAVSDADTSNSLPVFVDADGKLDSIYTAHGYSFGADIVKAAKGGNADASFILAQMYSYGIAGAKPDRRKAFKLYVGLADNGNNEAKASAGYMLMHGMGTEAEPSKGLNMMADAANAGCATAYLLMGNFYCESEPTPENIANAKLCYAQARDLGIVEADELLKKLE